MKSFWQKQSDLARILYILSAAVFLCGLAILLWFGIRYLRSPAADTVRVANTKSDGLASVPCAYRRLVDGVCVASPASANPRLVAVMIENARDAWPVSGVADASVVYEAPVEGNIPRFMAIYPADFEIGSVGPVRSARPYYLDWAAEYGNPVYMHVGGSDAALETIDERSLFDINEMGRGWYFWRSDERAAPHNTYTSSDLWQEAIASYGVNYPRADMQPWTFGDGVRCEAECIDRITIAFAPNNPYDVTWVYEPTLDKFVRQQGSGTATEVGGAVHAADTVIVQRVRAVVLDAIGRKQIDTIGSGETVVFAHGRAIAGSWRKTSAGARTEWLDADGKAIPLKFGKIWVEVVPQHGSVAIEPGGSRQAEAGEIRLVL